MYNLPRTLPVVDWLSVSLFTRIGKHVSQLEMCRVTPGLWRWGCTNRVDICHPFRRQDESIVHQHVVG